MRPTMDAVAKLIRDIACARVGDSGGMGGDTPLSLRDFKL